MVKHDHKYDAWWCLPGGGVEVDETPEQAAVRELYEECGVRGTVIRETSIVTFSPDPDDKYYTYLIDIGDQTPHMGKDPELGKEDQIIVDLSWISLAMLSERDRAYLWTAGLMSIPEFFSVITAWPREPAYPR